MKKSTARKSIKTKIYDTSCAELLKLIVIIKNAQIETNADLEGGTSLTLIHRIFENSVKRKKVESLRS